MQRSEGLVLSDSGLGSVRDFVAGKAHELRVGSIVREIGDIGRWQAEHFFQRGFVIDYPQIWLGGVSGDLWSFGKPVSAYDQAETALKEMGPKIKRAITCGWGIEVLKSDWDDLGPVVLSNEKVSPQEEDLVFLKVMIESGRNRADQIREEQALMWQV